MVERDARPARWIMVLLLLLMPCLAACTSDASGSADTRAALERYRSELSRMHPGKTPPDLEPDYALFASTVHLVLNSYVDASDPQVLVDKALEGMRRIRAINPEATDHTLTESAIDAMLTALDPHSAFLDAERASDLRERIHGEVAGIGATVAKDDNTGFLRVLDSGGNSPAARAGMRSGDLIVTIDGQQVQGMGLNDAAARLHGQAGHPVILHMLRPGSSVPMQVEVARAIFRVEPVTAHLEDGDIAYLGITTFNEHAEQELTRSIDLLRQQANGELKGAILDLRNNPGGLLEQGVKVVGRFLGQAEVVSTQGRTGKRHHYVSDNYPDLLRGVPLVVLINGFSTSASEIVAGALQDYGRALVMGTRSFGKGSVQTIFWLPEGQGIRLTTARYFRPSGTTVECYGIMPDLEVGLHSPMKEASEPDRVPCDPVGEPPRLRGWSEAEVCPSVGTSVDPQLACALSLLRAGRVATVAQRR